ncbi:MAG: phage major capsid protein [Holosporales bacterium]|jgi:HK97 family phage major capsid protein|nr:phage major capsid protein [Holosporales bacterium]
MNISEERPAIPSDPSYSDLKRFISYLKGDKNDQEEMSIPTTITNHIIDKIQALSPIKAISRVTTTSSDRLDVVVDSNDADESGWVTNEIIRSDDLATISKISIHLHQLFAKPKVAHSLLDDHSIKVEEFIKDKITTQMAASENKSFLFGDGINQPKGILRYEISTDGPQAKQIEGIVGGTIGSISDCSKIVELMELLPSKYLCGATWIMSRNAASHIRTIKDETTHRFLWQNSIAHGVPDTLLGYPVVICDDMPKVSEKTENACVPVLFANLYEGYHIAEKPNITILKDPYNSKPFIEFYATKRIGGDVVNFNAIKALVLTNDE